jgi:hypothetical protein
VTAIADTSVREWHEKAMEHADRAQRWRDMGDLNSARLESLHGYMDERVAADLCDEEPSRSVLYRSAATLALDAELPGVSIFLARKGLAGDPPPEIADELREVLAKAEDVSSVPR